MHGYKKFHKYNEGTHEIEDGGYFVYIEVELTPEISYLQNYFENQAMVKKVTTRSLGLTVYRVKAYVNTEEEAQSLYKRTVEECEIK